MRLLGTSLAPSSRFPHPPLFLNFLFPVCRPVRRSVQSDLAMVCLGWLNTGPSSGSLLVWPRGLVRECCPAGRPWTSTSLPRTSTQRHPNTWPFSRPRLAAVVREYGLPLVDLLDHLCFPPPMQLTSGAKAFNNHSPFPLVRPTFSAGERIKGHESRFHSLLLEYFGSDGQLSRPQPVLRCGILCSPVFSMCSFPSISPPVSLIRYGMVGTVAGDGAPRSLSVVRSSGVSWTRPFSFSDSSLVGPRPFSLPLSQPARALCVVYVALGCLVRYWLGFYLT